MAVVREDQYVGPFRLEKTLGKGQTGMQLAYFLFAQQFFT